MIGWLTVGPILLLALPLTAVPLADNFARNGKDIITVTRMLFSIPAGLALDALLRELILRRRWAACGQRSAVSDERLAISNQLPTNSLELKAISYQLSAKSSALSAFACLLSALVLLTVLPASHPWQNHFWHALARPPADLSFTQESAELAQLVPVPLHPSPFTLLSSSPLHPSPFSLQSSFRPPRIGSTTPVSRLLQIEQPLNILLWTAPKDDIQFLHYGHYSVYVRAPSDDYTQLIWPATNRLPLPGLIIIPTTRLYTPYSQAAQSSVHWNPADALFASTGMPELEALAQAKGLTPKRLPSGMILWKDREE